MRIFSIILLGLASLVATQSQVSGQSQEGQPGGVTASPAPIAPGGIRITIRAPEDWVKARTANPAQRVFACKPLACYNPATVLIVSAPTLARHPDPRALEVLAQTTLPKVVIAQSASQMILSDGKVETKILSSKVTKLASYPAILIETSLTGLPKPQFGVSGMIFAGPIMLTVTSRSTVLAEAEDHLNLFVSMMSFIEGPKPQNDVAAPQPVPNPVSDPIGQHQNL